MNNIYNLPPFKRFCMSIGNVPNTYIESLSYQELLYWLCEYLSKTVIPTINNNSEATKEIQDLFNKLQNYVNHYFDNLDVQKEINKKLDNMVSDGTLKSIFSKNSFRKFKPLLINNLWASNRTEEQLNIIINNQLKMGIEGFTVVIHLQKKEVSFDTLENINILHKVIYEFSQKGVYFSALKFHCNPSDIFKNKDLFLETVLHLISIFSDCNIKKIVIFNEISDGNAKDNIDFIKNTLLEISKLNYKVSISQAGMDGFASKLYNLTDALENQDFISINYYPRVGLNEKNTSTNEIQERIDQQIFYQAINDSNKEVIISEIGIRPYYNYFARTSMYQYDDAKNYSSEVLERFYRGIFESSLNTFPSELWLWFFPEEYNENIQKLFNFYLKGGEING